MPERNRPQELRLTQALPSHLLLLLAPLALCAVHTRARFACHAMHLLRPELSETISLLIKAAPVVALPPCAFGVFTVLPPSPQPPSCLLHVGMGFVLPWTQCTYRTTTSRNQIQSRIMAAHRHPLPRQRPPRLQCDSCHPNVRCAPIHRTLGEIWGAGNTFPGCAPGGRLRDRASA